MCGQLRGDKECPFSGVTKSGRVWRKVPESDARSVACLMTTTHTVPCSTLPKTTLCYRREKQCGFATEARADKSVAAQRV